MSSSARGDDKDRLSARFPELLQLLGSVAVTTEPSLSDPFAIEWTPTGAIRVDGRLGTDEIVHAALVRHAIEAIRLRRQLEPSRWPELRPLVAASAGRVAAIYVAARGPSAVSRFEAAAPRWLSQAYAALRRSLTDPELVALADRLVALIDRDAGATEREWTAPESIDTPFEALSAPSEFLLTLGGDDRLRVDPQTGLNRYGCSPRPRPRAITFASSTATSVSDHAYRAVDDFRVATVAALARGDRTAVSRAFEQIRASVLRQICDAPGDCLAILTTSGTDAELCVLHLALSRHEHPLVNIIVGSDETGSGVHLAASGCHFSSQSALGVAVDKGAPIDGLPTHRISVVDVRVRGRDGVRRSPDEVDADAEAAVARALAEGRRCLLHVIDQSKTGIRAPSDDCVRRLEEQYPGIAVAVDACQCRLPPSTLRHHLERGRILILTGSKFLTGPPFAGAVVVPASWTIDGSAALPRGFTDYFSADEWPERLRPLGAELSARSNLGLLCRWVAAIAETERFWRVPAAIRQRILGELSQFVRTLLEEAPFVEPLPFSGSTDHTVEDGPGSLQTIFTFIPRMRASARRVSWEQSQEVYAELNRDVSSLLPASATDAQRQLARCECHIGQPVRSSSDSDWGALRLSIGARTVSDLVRLDDASIAARIAQEQAEIATVFAKLELILDLVANSDAGASRRG